jgi:DNA invertase Pin-like site-specific DNA recombinase
VWSEDDAPDEVMTMAEQCKLVAYRRVSTKGQGVSGLGLEGQEQAIAAYAGITGCCVIATYTEVESGKVNARPELAKAIAHAKRSKATLVIAKLDRLSRNVAFLANLMESGVEFIACDNPKANDLTIHILAAVAQNEAKMISERTKAALAAYKARGGILGTNNLTAEGTLKGAKAGALAVKAKAKEAYSDVVPLILELKGQGMTQQAIADRLNTDGHTTRTGKPWGQVQVKRIIDRVAVQV